MACDKFHVKNDNAKIFVSFCHSGYRIHVIILYALIRGLNHLKDFFEIHAAIKSAPVVIKFSVYMYHHYQYEAYRCNLLKCTIRYIWSTCQRTTLINFKHFAQNANKLEILSLDFIINSMGTLNYVLL